MPKANSLGSTPHLAGNGSTTHAFNLANLPKANTLGANHQGSAKNGNPTQKDNLHALAAHNPNTAVVGAATKVGEDKQKLGEESAKLKTDKKDVATDKKNGTIANAALTNAISNEQSVQQKLAADQKSGAPNAIISQDLAKLKNAQAAHISAANSAVQAQVKLDTDKKTQQADKKQVTADKTDLKQDKQTLKDKEKIAQQGNEIKKLKNQQQDSNNQSSDNQSSNNQSADNGQNQGSSDNNSSNGSTQSASTNSSTGTNSTSTTDNAVARTTVASATVGTGLAARSLATPPLPADTSPPADPDPAQNADVGQTFVLVGFQKDVSNEDLAAFLNAYKASVVEGPNDDGLYKLQLTDQVPSDQMQQVLDSMKSQTNIVLSAVAD